MLGRQVFMQSLHAHGVAHLFGNPGTTESPLLDTLADYPSMQYVVALHEGVALGAASFYAQASGRTGIVNLHVAPGLGNALGMLYCAYKANSPMIVTAGQQDTRMRLRNPVLGHDLVAMAKPVVKWSVQAESADELAPILHRAFKIAHDPPAGPVFVALPINVMEQETRITPMSSAALYRGPEPDSDGIEAMIGHLLSATNPAFVIGDDVARARAGELAMQLAQTVGASVWVETLRAHSAIPNRHPNVRGALPVDAAGVAQCLAEHDVVLLAGGPFFEDVWYADAEPFAPGTKVLQLERSTERVAFNYALTVGVASGLWPAFSALLQGVEAGQDVAGRTRASQLNGALQEQQASAQAKYDERLERSFARSPMPMSVVMNVLAQALPENGVVVDESITASIDLQRNFDFRKPGDYFGGRGGGIGQGLPGAVGVKLALPDRPVMCISGDGSSMYSVQALWSAAHHGLPVVFVILANREYRILKHNLDSYRQRFESGSNQPYMNMDLQAPNLGFVEMAAGMGVEGCRVDTPEALRAAVDDAFAANAPRLIEVAVEGKR